MENPLRMPSAADINAIVEKHAPDLAKSALGSTIIRLANRGEEISRESMIRDLEARVEKPSVKGLDALGPPVRYAIKFLKGEVPLEEGLPDEP